VKARILLALGDSTGACEAMARARALAGHSEDAVIAAEVRLTGALLAPWEGGGEQVARELQTLSRQAARAGLRRVELEARLLRLELHPSQKGASRDKELTSLRRMANRLGYRVLLRRANAL
jgi:eukaryotic-like serine/threonine-protein kinase